MASSLSTTASASAVANRASYLPFHYLSLSKVSFRLSPKQKLRFLSTSSHCAWNHSVVVRAQLNEVSVDGSTNAASTPPTTSKVPALQAKDSQPSSEPSRADVATEESISEFIAQVSSLVKLVDSRDVVELQLKQLDCEIIIRKKEALPQPAPPAPVMMMHSPPPPTTSPQAYQAPPPAPAQATPPPSATSSAPPASVAKPGKSSLPPLKGPMAGTFYRSPAPGEPPFVKVGDKVQKGQVVCLIEAMKLMNEIEADQSGTIVEVIAEDGKPVSVDTPLFVIQP